MSAATLDRAPNWGKLAEAAKNDKLEYARKTYPALCFDGVNITTQIQKYFLSMTYTDSEEDEADDLQIKLQDKDGLWLQSWLKAAVEAANSTKTYSTGSAGASEATYTVNAKSGLNVRSGAGSGYSKLGSLSYGTKVTPTGTSGEWTKINYSGKTGYVFTGYLTKSGGGSGGSEKASGFLINGAIVKSNWKMDGKDAILDCGSFELDSVQASGPPSTVTIKATGLPFSASIRQTKKSKAWEAYSLSGIAQEIAKANGMACMFLAESDPYYKRKEQYNTSDIVFLSRLCKNAGISLKTSNRILILFDQATYEQKASNFTIRKGDKTYLKWDLQIGSTDSYTSCRVRYTSPTNGKVIEGIAYAEDADKAEKKQQLEIRAKVSNASEAKKLAEKKLREHNKFGRTATFTFPGNVTLCSGVTVTLSGWGPWDGKYIIKQAVHVVGPNGFTTKTICRKTLEGY